MQSVQLGIEVSGFVENLDLTVLNTNLVENTFFNQLF